MADKGGTGADFFKLTVKVDLIGKSNANKRLQEAFQGDIANLRQHLQSYPELQSQYIHCVKKKKKHLGFEFWLKNVNALEQLKLSTEKDSLVNALSDFSEKKGLGLDIGLGSQHLCFKCKIEEKQYAHAQAHFMEGSSESSDESDEADDQQKQSNEPPGAASGAEAKEKKVFGEFQKEEMTGKEPNQETSEVKNKASFFEQNNTSVTSVPVGHATKANNKEGEKLQPNEGTQLDHVQSVSASVSATVKETSECVIVKQFYLYVPFKDSEIQTVIMESNCRELKGKRLKLVSDSKYLWEVIVELNPSTLDKHGTFHFVVDRIEQGYFTSKKVSLRDENVYKIDSSAIQRMFWKRISENGFLCHVQHIMLHCAEDTKDSILQMEALVTVVSPNLNNREIINVVKDLEKDNFLSDNKRSLMFVVLLGCFKQRKSLVEVVNDNVFDMLFHALCQLKRTDVLSSCMSNLHELSYFVVQRKYGKEFSLIHWMTHVSISR